MATKRNTRGKVVSDANVKTPGSKRYKVADGTQVYYDGTVYVDGETLEAPEAVAQEWVVRGYVTEASK